MLSHLHLYNLRNINEAKLNLLPRWNIFIGDNGSGKTSLLEGIYLLGTGYSFRTHHAAPLIRDDEEALIVFSRMQDEQTLSLKKTRNGTTLVKHNQQACQRSSELAQLLPCQLFYQDLFAILEAGPLIRRRLLDWGVFHVKHTFHHLWKDYRRVVKQRNALLRQQATTAEFLPWDTLLVKLAVEIDALRASYIDQLQPFFQHYLSLLTNMSCTLLYEKGWGRKDSDESLAEVLKRQLHGDKQRQYTQSGPHQADLRFLLSNQQQAKYRLSRGQQKMLLIALKLAQARLLNQRCLYLLDDITAELDAEHSTRVLNCIDQLPGQFFLTLHDKKQVALVPSSSENQYYLIEQGKFSCFT